MTAPYYDKYERRGAVHWDWFETRPWYRQLVTTVIQHFAHNAAGTLLDVGCGDGLIAYQLCHHHAVCGIDLNYTGIQLARQKSSVLPQPHRLEFFVMEYAALSRFAPTFEPNYVLLFNTIEHLENPIETLNYMLTMWRPLREIMIVTDVPSDRKGRFHVEEFTPQLLRERCAALPCEVVPFDTGVPSAHGVVLRR